MPNIRNVKTNSETLARLPDTEYMGCALYISVDEEYAGHALEYAEILARVLKEMADRPLFVKASPYI